MNKWLPKTSDGKFKIEKIECPHPSDPVDLMKPAAGVMHTTEGGWDSAMSVFKQHYAPNFLCGDRRIAQLVPLGTMAAALENASGGVETNRWARVQIEVVGFSKEQPYSFIAGVNAALASLLATLKVEASIPLTRPYPDTMPAKPWATPSFKRRHDGKWGKTSGWFGHVEIPENAHWDPGYLLWSPLVLEAMRRLPKQPNPRPKPKPLPKVPSFQVSVTDLKGHTTVKETKLPGKYLSSFGAKLISATVSRLEKG